MFKARYKTLAFYFYLFNELNLETFIIRIFRVILHFNDKGNIEHCEI